MLYCRVDKFLNGTLIYLILVSKNKNSFMLIFMIYITSIVNDKRHTVKIIKRLRSGCIFKVSS